MSLFILGSGALITAWPQVDGSAPKVKKPLVDGLITTTKTRQDQELRCCSIPVGKPLADLLGQGIPVATAENPTNLSLTCIDRLVLNSCTTTHHQEPPQVSGNIVGFTTVAT